MLFTYYSSSNQAIDLLLPTMLIRLITWMFVIGIVYRLLTRYVFPIFRFTSVASDRLRQMQDQMKEMDNKINNTAKQNKKVKKEGDYIDYEEVK